MVEIIKTHNWPALFGYFLFIGMMAAGYFYNLTFVQLGLEDFGTRILGLSAKHVAIDMALLALLTSIFAIAFGWWMQSQGWGRCLQIKLRLSFVVVLVQTFLTFLCSSIRTEGEFLFWLVGVSLALGVGVPVMFSMTVDLVPVRMRGGAAALVTASAYFFAETLSSEWTFEAFRRNSLMVLTGGVIGMGALASLRHPWMAALAAQHRLPEFAHGRLIRRAFPKQRFFGLLVIMFGTYFVDSLGFLRLLKTPIYMLSAWQSSDFDIRSFIAIVHVVGALIAGVLYGVISERSLFMWIFGIFALTHLQYNFHIQTGSMNAVLSMPMLYALAVSLYTVMNFVIWADSSTPDTISLNSALGVALSGWTATFLSTALAMLAETHVSLGLHIRIVDSLAMLFFLIMLLLSYLQPSHPSQRTDSP